MAVEYIIPYAFHSRESAPPVLFGKPFVQNDVFQLWGLHAWVWENNPSGMFANWNPNVNCDNTTDIMAMAHNLGAVNVSLFTEASDAEVPHRT